MKDPGSPVIVYARVSTAGQATEGVSLEAQEAKAKAWAVYQERTVGGVYVDAGLSGSRADNRPELAAALDAVTKTKGTLVVYSLSRLARSTRDTIDIVERLEKAGASLISLSEDINTNGAAGRMVLRLLASLAEFERDQVAERTAAAMAHKRSKLEYCGGAVPFGFNLDADGVHIVENAQEQAAIRDILALRDSDLSYRAIAAELADRGIGTRAGRPWAPKVLRGIVQRHGEAA